jgi:hypothetical protein
VDAQAAPGGCVERFVASIPALDSHVQDQADAFEHANVVVQRMGRAAQHGCDFGDGSNPRGGQRVNDFLTNR